MNTQEYDYVVIGSGFGGSVSAMRLAEKGYKVLLLEKGKRYKDKDYPKSDWNIRKFLWAPFIRCFGIQQLTFFRKVFVLSGVGVGGGSNVYANTHMVPKDDFFNNPVWKDFKDWKAILMPFYDRAKYMLGTTPYDDFQKEDYILKEIAEDMGRGDTFSGVNAGVYTGDTEEAKDPYFNGLGPLRKGCVKCAGCMVGCRYGAKNTLSKNYLHFAEHFGAEILPESKAHRITYQNRHYEIEVHSTTSWFRKKKKLFKSKGLIVSGGVLGTLSLLMDQKHGKKTLPDLSDTLGRNIMTNAEMLCGVTNIGEKMNHGIAITSVFNADKNTHIEVVKYNSDSGVMGRLAMMAVGPGSGIVRTAKLIGKIISRPFQFLKSFFHFHQWGKDTIILLVMQNLEESLKMRWRKGFFRKGLAFDNRESHQKVPAYIPIGQEVMYRYAEKTGGIPQNVAMEIFLNTATTAHILGGCPMGKDKSEGVVNDRFEVHGYPNMYILDGSIIPCNLGVNPSLTITTLSEYAMSMIPEKEGNTHIPLQQQLKHKIQE
ncbi:GMC family oxidoreductase [Algivirga pacifica]|uniref:Cholesterol oxidase n=1 Tax=Algivirga pacifica TaxID=1162670 RepID=A0ABP9D3F5_9BACT